MKQNTNNSSCCLHKNGVMIPETDLNGNYIKPIHQLCTDCRLVFKIQKGD